MGKLLIVEMDHLSPMYVRWREDEKIAEEKELLVFLNFVQELAFDAKGKRITGDLGDAILAILRNKKKQALAVQQPLKEVGKTIGKNKDLMNKVADIEPKFKKETTEEKDAGETES